MSNDSCASRVAAQTAEHAVHVVSVTLAHPSTSVQSKRSEAGFSLIELLVVIVIIGVLVFAVTLSIASGAQRQLQREAERFQALISQACAQAELSGREIGVVVDPGGYSFRLLSGTEWQDFPDDSVLRRRPWVDGVQVELSREGRNVDLFGVRAASPQLVCFSSGELTPFTLALALADAPHYQVSGAEDATLKTERVGTTP